MQRKILITLALIAGMVGLVCSPQLHLAVASEANKLPRVLVLATGGTIAGKASGTSAIAMR